MTELAEHLALYRMMLRIRLLEERIADEYAQQEMRCPVHLSIGQEAAAAGVCHALSPQDWAVSGHRAHAHYVAKGGALGPMIAEMYGKETGVCGGRGGSMHLIDLEAGFLASTPIVASTIPVGVGAAFSAHRRGEDRVVVIFLGEAATEEGTFHEAVNFAAVHQLPVLFVCENNLYSVYTPMGPRQPPNRSPAELVAGHGIATDSGDGNDVVEVLALARRAIAGLRGGGGPVFLELATYRWREHCGPNFDDQLSYRPIGELDGWMELDPLRRSRDVLLASGVEQAELDAARAHAQRAVDEAFAFAARSRFPPEATAGLGVYA